MVPFNINNAEAGELAGRLAGWLSLPDSLLLIS